MKQTKDIYNDRNGQRHNRLRQKKKKTMRELNITGKQYRKMEKKNRKREVKE